MGKRALFTGLTFVIIVGSYATYAFHDSSARTPFDVEWSLDAISLCTQKHIKEQLSCLEPVIRDLLAQDTIATASSLIENTYPLECHAIMHVVGRYLYKNSSSVEEALAKCEATCHSGCKHGVVGAVFSDSVSEEKKGDGPWHPAAGTITEEAKRLCTGVDECHTVGHILFQVAGSITGALKQCDTVARESELVMCYRGAFMESMEQNIPFLDGVDTPAISYRDPSELLAPCNAFPSRYSRACFHFLHIQNRATFEEQGVAEIEIQKRIFKNACAELESQWDRDSCYEGVGFQFKNTGDCTDVPRASERAACIFGVSHVLTSDVPRIQRGVQECGNVTELLSRRACYQSIFLSADSRSVTPLEGLCDDVGDPQCAITLDAYTNNPRDLVFNPLVILANAELPSEKSLVR